MQVREYVVRRLLKLPLVLLAVTVAVFALSRVGGSPIAIYLEHEMSPEEVQALEERYGVDEPLPMQYIAWLGGILRGDLGWSGVSVAPVSEVLPARLVATIELATLGSLIAIALGIGLGTYAGARRNRFSDHVIRVLTVSGASLPLFWFALMMLILFYLIIPIAPLGRFDPDVYSQITHYTGFYTIDSILNLSPSAFLDAIVHLALPAFVLGFEGMAVVARMMRSSLLEVMREDYIRTARAKGVWTRLIMRRHALRNAMLPVVTVIGLEFAFLIGGLVVTEQVFNINGIGKLFVDATARGDFNLIQGLVLLIATIFVLVNLVVDLLYGWLDPRIRLR